MRDFFANSLELGRESVDNSRNVNRRCFRAHAFPPIPHRSRRRSRLRSRRDPAETVGTAYGNPSITTSKITTVVIRNARRVAEPDLDAGEEVSVELVPIEAIPSMIREGRFDHALTVMGLLWWMASGPGGVLAQSPDDGG